MKKNAILISASIVLIMFISCKTGKNNMFTPVGEFNVEKYMGTWYEIVRFPHSFEKDLTDVTATYTIINDNKVEVLNKGLKFGKEKTAKGKAKFAGDKDKGHFKVSFFGPFYADYIILELDKENYNYALVTSSSYNYLWILARTPQLDDEILNKLLKTAEDTGFDLSKKIKVSHNINK